MGHLLSHSSNWIVAWRKFRKGTSFWATFSTYQTPSFPQKDAVTVPPKCGRTHNGAHQVFELPTGWSLPNVAWLHAILRKFQNKLMNIRLILK